MPTQVGCREFHDRTAQLLHASGYERHQASSTRLTITDRIRARLTRLAITDRIRARLTRLTIPNVCAVVRYSDCMPSPMISIMTVGQDGRLETAA